MQVSSATCISGGFKNFRLIAPVNIKSTSAWHLCLSSPSFCITHIALRVSPISLFPRSNFSSMYLQTLHRSSLSRSGLANFDERVISTGRTRENGQTRLTASTTYLQHKRPRRGPSEWLGALAFLLLLLASDSAINSVVRATQKLGDSLEIVDSFLVQANCFMVVNSDASGMKRLGAVLALKSP